MTSAFSWQTFSLCPASFCKVKLACYSSLLLTSYFCIPVPYDEKDIFFFLMLVQKGLVGLHRTDHLLHHTISGWGIEWFALETNRDHSIVFEIIPKYCISDSC